MKDLSHYSSNLNPIDREIRGRLLLKNSFQAKMLKKPWLLMPKNSSFLLSALAQILMAFFLAQGLAFAKSPSFVFSEEEGLQALPAEQAPQNQKSKASPSQAKTQPESAVSRPSAGKPKPASPSATAQNSGTKAENKASTLQPVLSPSVSPNFQGEGDRKAENVDLNSTPEPVSDLKPISPLKGLAESEAPPDNSLSENFAPQEEEPVEKASFLDTLSEDVSWFFEKRKTKYKIAVTPDGGYDTTRGLHLGLRLFSYSSDEKGYYFALSGSKYISGPFSRFNLTYISPRKNSFRTEGSFIYDNHYENYFGEGMSAKLSDLKQLYAYRFVGDYKIFYQAPEQALYTGLGTKLIFRKEIPNEKGKTQFENEFFLLLKALAGYDDRDNWRNPKKGSFHQLALVCKAIFDIKLGHCKGEGDFRLYISPFKGANYHFNLKNSVLALRAFAGYSFLSPSPYSITYILSGESLYQDRQALRGFKHNRFRGDKMYFFQAEARVPIWHKYLGGVLFAELGEAAKYAENFEGFVMDYGGGIRVGLPPRYDVKLRLDFGMGRDRQNELNYNAQFSFLHAF